MDFEIKKSDLLNLSIIEPVIKEDFRGTYVELYNREFWEAHFKEVVFKRDCISTSSKGVLRGLHYDNCTWKLIQCLKGRLMLVVVNMREDSETYMKAETFIISDTNRVQILVPPNFANGHFVLSDNCIFHYKMSEYYMPENEKTLKWNDKRINIFWPCKSPLLSEKDS